MNAAIRPIGPTKPRAYAKQLADMTDDQLATLVRDLRRDAASLQSIAAQASRLLKKRRRALREVE